MSTEAWKLEKDLCRCCHAEGSFHDLAEPRFHLGQQEIYSEMLRQALNVDLTPVTGVLCSMTFTICEGCIQRLRDASSFKKQVLMCEERFKDMYSNVMKALNPALNPSLEVKVELQGTDQEDIKEEHRYISDDDDRFGVPIEDDDDDDDKTVLQIKLDNAKKAKAKAKATPKPKVKKVSERKSERPKKAAGKAETASKAEDKPKKGKEETQQYTIKEDDGKKTFVCNICSRGFKKRMYFKQHYKNVHLKLKLGACYLCGVKIPAHLRAAHLEKSHGIPAPTCGICNKKFSFPNQVLRHHKSEHMGERNYECLTCYMRFPTKDRLKRHEVKHSPIETFVCNYCGKSFKWKKNLFTHIKIHLNDRRYACALCGTAFVHRTSLRYHLAKHHPNFPSTSADEPLEYVLRHELPRNEPLGREAVKQLSEESNP